MVFKHPNSWTWTIDNYKDAKFINFCHSFSIVCKEEEFYFCFEPIGNVKNLEKHAVLYLFWQQSSNYNTHFNVLWKIALINGQGNECYSNEIDTTFTPKSHKPIKGGIYNIDRNYILDPSNRLLSNGKLTVKCEVIILEDSNVSRQIIQSLDIKALQNYQSLLEKPKFSDVVFVVGCKQFQLHKNILSVRSPVFAAMFESDLEETKQNRVEIIDVDVEVFEKMLHYIYGANVESIDNYAEDLLVASDKYQLESLKQVCVQSLVANLTIESVAKVLTLADMHNVTELKLKCKDFVTNKNATKVMATEGWKLMAKSRVELLMEMYEDLALKNEDK